LLSGENYFMRIIRSASAAAALAGVAFVMGAATSAYAAGPQIDVYPTVATPGQSVSFSIVCIKGSSVGTSATLYGQTLGVGQVKMSPATHKGVFQVSVTLPSNASGSYTPPVGCSNGINGLASLTVRTGPVTPVGPPVTGDGITSTATDGTVTGAGAVLLGIGGFAGALAVRRRRRA
jgi:hypothetical protein